MIDQFTDVIQNMINNTLQGVNTCLPATIETYDPILKKVSVKPFLNQELNGEEIETPIIEGVPIIFPCTKNAVMSLPISKGDGCLLVFTQRSIDDWLAKGTILKPTDPRRFDLSDAIAIPGLFNFKDAGREITGENVEIYNDAGNVEIQGTEDNAVRFSKLEEKIAELTSKLNNHVHPNVIIAVSGGSGAPAVGVTGSSGSSITDFTTDISSAKVENVTLP